MSFHTILYTILFTFIPIFELRGALPYAYFNDIPLWLAYLITVPVNALVAPLGFFFLNTFHNVFYRWNFYKKIFDASVLRARKRIEPKIKKSGYWGLMIFVMIPLPITGAYTGTLGAWVLGLNPKKTFLAVLGGVIISGIIVTVITYLGIEAFSFFVKEGM